MKGSFSCLINKLCGKYTLRQSNFENGRQSFSWDKRFPPRIDCLVQLYMGSGLFVAALCLAFLCSCPLFPPFRPNWFFPYKRKQQSNSIKTENGLSLFFRSRGGKIKALNQKGELKETNKQQQRDFYVIMKGNSLAGREKVMLPRFEKK